MSEPRDAWQTPALNTLSVSMDTAAKGGSDTDGQGGETPPP